VKYGAAVLDAPTLPALELKPPRKAEVEGVFKMPGSAHHNRIIYSEVVVDAEATMKSARVKTDKQGNEIWKRNPTTGEAIYPFIVKDVVMVRKRFVLLPDNRNRHVKKVYHFEPTAEEITELAQREAETTFFRDFVKEAAKAGLTAAQVISRIKADIVGPGEDVDQVEPSITEDVVAAEMAKLEEEEGGVVERAEDGDALGEGEEPSIVISSQPVTSPTERRVRRKKDAQA
jgi:hypothetical protein